MPRNREPNVFGLDHDYSVIGTFEVEVQLQKGQEIKADLKDIGDGLRNGKLVDKGVEVEVLISPNLNLFILPRFPVDRYSSDARQHEETAEPFVIADVKVDVEEDEDEVPTLLMSGTLDEDADAGNWIYKFDPLAGHEILAIAKDGNYLPGSIRASSGEGASSLRFEIS